MAEYSSPFNDSVLNHFETNSQQTLSYFDGSYVDDGWVTAVDQPMLLRFLKRLQKEDEPLKFYWGNFKGPMSTVNHTSNEFDGGEELSATYPGDKKITVGDVKLKSLHTKIRARVGEKIDPDLAYAIDFDLSNSYRLKQITYTIYFLFVEGTEQKEDDLIAKISSLDVSGNRIEEDLIVAVKFETHNYYSFALLARALEFEIEDIIKKKFDAAYNKIPKGDWEQKKAFYQKAPRSYLSNGDIDLMWKDFKGLMKYDFDSSWNDSSSAMVRCLGAIAGHDGGLEYLYKKFNSSGSFIKTVYNLLQSSSYSKEQHTQSPNKAIFASLLLSICSYQGQGLNAQRNKTKYEFRIDKRWYSVYGDDRTMGYYTLAPMKWKEGDEYPDYVDGVAMTENMSGFKQQRKPKDFHPLDMVTVWFPGPAEGSESFKMFVPAIFVYNIAYHREWAAIAKLIRLGIDLLIIAVSAATLTAGAGALFTLISLTEIGFATTDFAVQSFEKEIRSIKPWGPEFLDKWEEIYFAGQFVTGLASLPSLVNTFGKLILKISESNIGQFILMVKLSLQYADEFPEFVGDYIIYTLSDYQKHFSGKFTRAMKNLNEEGALLIKGKEVGDVNSSLFLNYKGLMIGKGSATEIGRLVRQIGSKGVKGIRSALERLYTLKTGTGGGFRYIDEVESTKMVGQELEMSCSAACIRQIAKDNDVLLNESVVREFFKAGDGNILTDQIGIGLQKALPNEEVISGWVYPPSFNMDMKKGVLSIMEEANGPWIASMLDRRRSVSVAHSIIVDRIENNIVYIRDPWGPNWKKELKDKNKGAICEMELDEFIYVWEYPGAFYTYVKK